MSTFWNTQIFKIVPRRKSPHARTLRKVCGRHSRSRTLRVADAGGRFSVFSAAEVPQIRLGSALDRGGLPRNKFSPLSPRRIPRRNFYSAKNKICRIPRRRQSHPLAPTRTQVDSIGVRRGIVPPPRLPQFWPFDHGNFEILAMVKVKIFDHLTMT